MSYLVTIEPKRREVGIRSNCEEITPDNYNNNIYKTKLDLSIRNPRNGSSFPLVSSSTNEVTLRDKSQVSEIISLEGESMEDDSTSHATAVERREEDKDAGVETKSCGKISALISHFKNVQETTRPEKTVPKVPAKKLRIDIQSVALDNPTSSTKTINMTSSNQDIETSGKIPHGNVSFPRVKLNFKMHVEETTQLHQNQTLENKIIQQNKQFPARNIITTKPLVMPRSFINSQTHCILPQQTALQPKEISNVNSSDQVHPSPINKASKPGLRDFSNSEVNNASKRGLRDFSNSEVNNASKPVHGDFSNSEVNNASKPGPRDFSNSEVNNASKPGLRDFSNSEVNNASKRGHGDFSNSEVNNASKRGHGDFSNSEVNNASKPGLRDFSNSEVNNVQGGVQQSRGDDAASKSHISECDNTAVKNSQESDSGKTDPSHSDVITTVTASSCIDPENQIVPAFTDTVVGDIEARTEIRTANYIHGNHGNGMVCIPVKERQVGKNDAASTSEVPSAASTSEVPSAASMSEVPSAASTSEVPSAASTSEVPSAASMSQVPSTNSPLTLTTVKLTSAEKDLKIMKQEMFETDNNKLLKQEMFETDNNKLLKQEMFETDNRLLTRKVTVTVPVTSNTNNDVHDSVSKDKVTTSDPVNSEPDSNSYLPQIEVSFHNGDLVTESCSYNTFTGFTKRQGSTSCAEDSQSLVNKSQFSTSSAEDSQSPATEYSTVSDRINIKLDILKSELMAMRRMDLVLLRQLINISQRMQRIHRADVLRVSRSLTFLNPNKTMTRRCRPVERQNSAPHCADRRRFLFSHLKSNTEDDYRDSLSSFDESEVDSAPSEVEESTVSLNSVLNNSPRSATNRRSFFHSRDFLVSLDVAEDGEQNYEDILRRNVRLWKMSFEKHQAVQEEVDVWF